MVTFTRLLKKFSFETEPRTGDYFVRIQDYALSKISSMLSVAHVLFIAKLHNTAESLISLTRMT